MIRNYLSQTLYHQAKLGDNEYSQPTFAKAVEIKGRWVEKRRIVRNAQGREVVSEISVTLAGDSAVAPGDRLSSDGELYFDVITVSSFPGLGGAPLTKRAYC
ncbi:MAG: hypothetical protein JXA87_03890 [Thermoleophilia bacterium]|nr:hypothetical protein [Thermoleophilia bacterium]